MTRRTAKPAANIAAAAVSRVAEIVELQAKNAELADQVHDLEKLLADAKEGFDAAVTTAERECALKEKAEKTIEELLQRLQDNEHQQSAQRQHRTTLQVERDHAVKAEAATREQFADLKERLHRSEMENARLGGYIQRVAEDDGAREEPRQIVETHVVPRRRTADVGHAHYQATDGYGLANGRQGARHWTGY